MEKEAQNENIGGRNEIEMRVHLAEYLHAKKRTRAK